jgi:pimeloyl-ACP methyl ester carboxylesterase
VLSFSYSNLPRAQLALGPTRALCQTGGEPSEPGGAPGYAFYGNPTAADFESIMFAAAARPVIDAAAGLRNRDPCGDTNSIIPSLLQQRKYLPRVGVPVLVLCGTRDALYSRIGCEAQVERYTRSRRVTLELVRGAGHALTIERTARGFRRAISRWLAANGF